MDDLEPPCAISPSWELHFPMVKGMRFVSELITADGSRFDRPLLVFDGKGNVVEDNMREFLAWRKRTDPVAYKSAMDGLVSVFAEIVARELMPEAQIGQPGYAFFWACRERMRRSKR